MSSFLVTCLRIHVKMYTVRDIRNKDLWSRSSSIQIGLFFTSKLSEFKHSVHHSLIFWISVSRTQCRDKIFLSNEIEFLDLFVPFAIISILLSSLEFCRTIVWEDLISVKVGKPTKSKTADFEQVSKLNISTYMDTKTSMLKILT